jgi:hypothetical protein
LKRSRLLTHRPRAIASSSASLIPTLSTETSQLRRQHAPPKALIKR